MTAARRAPGSASHSLEYLSPRAWRIAVIGSSISTVVLLLVLRRLEPVGGSTPKFVCTLADGTHVKVKYGNPNGERKTSTGDWCW